MAADFTNDDRAGWVYILQNPALAENYLKIGRTTRLPEERARELSASTGVPVPFEVAYSERVNNCFRVEREVHELLRQYRVNDSREFFNVPVDIAISVIQATARAGFICLLSNPSFGDQFITLVATTTQPDEFARELSSQAHTPFAFEVAFHREVKDRYEALRKADLALETYRVPNKLGFYQIDVESGSKIVNDLFSNESKASITNTTSETQALAEDKEDLLPSDSDDREAPSYLSSDIRSFVTNILPEKMIGLNAVEIPKAQSGSDSNVVNWIKKCRELMAAIRNGRRALELTDDIETLLHKYITENGWHNIDQIFFEVRKQDSMLILISDEDRFAISNYLQLIVDHYRSWVVTLARFTSRATREYGPLASEQFQQRFVYFDEVEPRVAQGKTAYFILDGLSYCHGRKLLKLLCLPSQALSARLAEIPTLPGLCMSAMLPLAKDRDHQKTLYVQFSGKNRQELSETSVNLRGINFTPKKRSTLASDTHRLLERSRYMIERQNSHKARIFDLNDSQFLIDETSNELASFREEAKETQKVIDDLTHAAETAASIDKTKELFLRAMKLERELIEEENWIRRRKSEDENIRTTKKVDLAIFPMPSMNFYNVDETPDWLIYNEIDWPDGDESDPLKKILLAIKKLRANGYKHFIIAGTRGLLQAVWGNEHNTIIPKNVDPNAEQRYFPSEDRHGLEKCTDHIFVPFDALNYRQTTDNFVFDTTTSRSSYQRNFTGIHFPTDLRWFAGDDTINKEWIFGGCTLQERVVPVIAWSDDDI